MHAMAAHEVDIGGSEDAAFGDDDAIGGNAVELEKTGDRPRFPARALIYRSEMLGKAGLLHYSICRVA